MELKIEHISKRFKDKMAVDDVSLTLTTGVWGLLGANGAGKTTLMRMIADIMEPSNGSISFDGEDIRKMGADYRNIFGFLPQDFGYSRDFTVKDYLEYVAALKDVPPRETTKKINHLLDILTLSDVKGKKIAKLSGGMKRRVGIAQAMLNDPKILVMDEPTAGLDPGERVRFRNFISEFSHNRIVLISTHIVSDIEYTNCLETSMQMLFSIINLPNINLGQLQIYLALAGLLSIVSCICCTLFLSAKCKDALSVLLISIVVILVPFFAYTALGVNWISAILPSAGIGMQNNFLYQLINFNYLHIGGMSFWTPHIILISAAIEVPIFLFLAVRSYCKHQVAYSIV